MVLILALNKSDPLGIMDENLQLKAVETIQEIYKDTLFKKAIACIETTYPNTDEYILRDLQADELKVGCLSYYTEEGVLSASGEQQGLTEADIGQPCEYWEITLGIDSEGEVYEYLFDNYDPEQHPEWERISKE